MNKCIYEKEFIQNGYSISFGIENGCKLQSNDLKLCEKCLEVAEQRQKEFFNKFIECKNN